MSEQNEIPTPRTANEEVRFNHVDTFDDKHTVPADFARQLERELASCEADKARLDWLEKQSTLAVWNGTFSDSEYNQKLHRAGAPICTLSTMDDDGSETLDEICGANTLRQAIDAALAQSQQKQKDGE